MKETAIVVALQPIKRIQLHNGGIMNIRKKTIFTTFTISALISLLVACGGGGDSTPQTTAGVFIDSPVEGLRYVSGDINGTTGTNGAFQCQSTVQFYIGDILLGEATCGEIITPVDLVSGATDHSHPTVINIARFLQTLDDDGNPSNGISITATVADLTSGESVDFSQSIADFENNSGVQTLVNTLTSARNAGATNLVSSTNAQAHLESSMFGLLAGTYTGTYSGDDSGTWTIVINSSGTIIGENSDGDTISGSITSNGAANFAAGTAGSSTFSGAFTNNGNASGTWQDEPESGTWSGNKTSTSTDTSSINDNQLLDSGNTDLGTITFSGADAIPGSVESTFSPTYEAPVYFPQYDDRHVTWTNITTLPFPEPFYQLLLQFDIATGDIVRVSLEATYFQDRVFRYSRACALESCADLGITANDSTKEVTFTDTLLSVWELPVNPATGPITLNGTITYED